MKKAVAIICAIIIFAFSLIGCGDKDKVALLKAVEKKQRLTRNRQPFVCNIR